MVWATSFRGRKTGWPTKSIIAKAEYRGFPSPYWYPTYALRCPDTRQSRGSLTYISTHTMFHQ